MMTKYISRLCWRMVASYRLGSDVGDHLPLAPAGGLPHSATGPRCGRSGHEDIAVTIVTSAVND